MDYEVFFLTFLELHKIDPPAPGERHRVLFSRVEFYQKQIKALYAKNPDVLLPLIVKYHGLLVSIESSRPHSNILSSSVNLLQNLIAKHLKSHN